ncbi:unnamed protein product, partial [marine sediment metagenome]
SVTFSLASGEQVTKPVDLTVHDFVLPFPFTLLTASDTHDLGDGIHANQPYDDEILIEYGMDPTRIYGGYDDMMAGGLDFFKQRIAMGQKRFSLYGGALDKYRDFLNKVQEAGLMDHFFFYAYDEVRPGKYEEMGNWTKERNEEFGIKTLVTVNQPNYGTPETANLANIWCPSNYITPDRVQTLRDASCDVWMYGAAGRRRYFPNHASSLRSLATSAEEASYTRQPTGAAKPQSLRRRCCAARSAVSIGSGFSPSQLTARRTLRRPRFA